MSFILDALKKSEREREQLAQGLQPDVIYRRSHAQPVWMIIVITLLVANMALVTVMWLRNDHQSSAPMITVNNGTPASPAAIATTPVNNNASASNESSDLRSLHDEASPTHDAQDETAAVLANAKPPDGPPLVRQINLDETGKSTSNINSNVTSSASIPTLDGLGGNSALNLPPIHLDIHVFSINAAERFVFINMRKYTEGQQLKEGPTVEHITSDGAILRYQDHQFLLPRQ